MTRLYEASIAETDSARRRAEATRGSFLVGASTRQDASDDVVIAFVACELLEAVARGLQADDGGPGFRPDRRVGDRHFIVDPVGTDPGEALDELQLIGRSHEVAFRGK